MTVRSLFAAAIVGAAVGGGAASGYFVNEANKLEAQQKAVAASINPFLFAHANNGEITDEDYTCGKDTRYAAVHYDKAKPSYIKIVDSLNVIYSGAVDKDTLIPALGLAEHFC
jgi:hypothetical protein